MAFINLAKAFDNVNREVCGRSFMMAWKGRCYNQENSLSLSISKGVKQGCVLAPTFPCCHTSHCDKWRISWCLYPLSFWWPALQPQKTASKDKGHARHNHWAAICWWLSICSGLWMSVNIAKTKVMVQLAPGADIPACPIAIHGEALEVVNNFTYMRSVLSKNAIIDDDISHRIKNASSSYGRLQRTLKTSTKFMVDQAVVLTTVLYGCEAWTPYRRNIKDLERFH